MDTASTHLPYIIGAYAFGLGILTLLARWVAQADDKARQQLAAWKSDEP